MRPLKKIEKYLNKLKRNTFLQSKTLNIFVVSLVFFIIVSLSYFSSLAPEKYELSVGERAPADIKAPWDMEDKEATDKLIEKAIESVEPKDKIDPTIQIDIKKKIEQFFKYLYETRTTYNNGEKNLEELILDLNKYNTFSLKDDELYFLINTSQSSVENLESYSYDVVTQIMSTGIKKEELDEKKESIEEYFMKLEGFSSRLKNIAIKIANNSIRENTFLDKELTQNKINEAIKKVEKVYVKKGQLIVSEGEEISNRQYSLLVEANMINDSNDEKIMSYVGAIIIILLLEIIIFAYLYYFNKKIFNNISNLYLTILIFLIILLISKSINSISSYLIPIGTASMLIGILINPRIAIVINIFLSVLITLITSNTLLVFITLLIGGTVAAISVSNTNQRTSIFLAGLIVSFCNFIVIFSFGLIYNNEIRTIMLSSFYGVLNGLLCSILTIGSLPLWEYVFDVLTPIKLLELSNPNSPLLKKLLVEAPGTYHHSIIVGNLSESATQAIGGNALLARVGSYYHDIGKLTRPYFFKENQLTSENPHDKVSPKISSVIIKNHIKDGVELAHKHKLPKEIIKFIEEHHGTTLVKYFYHKALSENEEKNNINKEDYKYHGPNPSSKESAIIMLADSVEAAVRSMAEPTKKNIETLIRKITEDKLNSGQLNNCDLTFKDIETINIVFVNTLMGIFHERIEYPEIDEKELEANN